MINDPRDPSEFYCYLPLLWAVFWCPAQLLYQKRSALMIQFLHFYSTRGWEPGIIKRFFSERARSGLRSWLLPTCFTSLSLSKDADRLVYLISPSYYTDYSSVYFCFICFTTEFYVGNSSDLYYYLFMIYIFRDYNKLDWNLNRFCLLIQTQMFWIFWTDAGWWLDNCLIIR